MESWPDSLYISKGQGLEIVVLPLSHTPSAEKHPATIISLSGDLLSPLSPDDKTRDEITQQQGCGLAWYLDVGRSAIWPSVHQLETLQTLRQAAGSKAGIEATWPGPIGCCANVS